MVVIRLAKSGAKKAPYFFITVADSRKPRDGRFIERLGFFNPSARGSEERLRFNLERYEYWVSKGAQPSEKVLNLKMQAELSPEELEKLFKKRDSRRISRKEAKAVKLAEELKASAESEVKESPSEEGSDTPENESTLATSILILVPIKSIKNSIPDSPRWNILPPLDSCSHWSNSSTASSSLILNIFSSSLII